MPGGASRFDAVIVLLADGARPDVMERLAAAGEMPALKQHFADAGGLSSAVGVFPSVTGPAHLPVLTGIHPGRANVPGIRWAERPKNGDSSFLGRTRSYMTLLRRWKLERDIPSHVQSLFAHVPGMADVNAVFVRGCPGKARRARFTKAAAFLRSLLTRDWYRSDGQAEWALGRALDRGFPSAFAVFPAIDELGHRFGPLCEESYEAYRRFDGVLARLFDRLAREGRADRTLVLVTSDHGQTGTHTHLDVDDLVAEIYPRTLSYPKLWRHLFDTEAVVMVSGNSMANVYLRGERGWRERPDFDAPGGRPAELRARLLAHPAIAHVIHRGADGGFVIAGAGGRLVFHEEQDGRGDGQGAGGAHLRVRVEGQSPLGDGGLPARASRADLFARSLAGPFPDGLGQVVDFFRAARAGDLVVCARPGFDLRSRFEYQPHNGSHGCLDREHLLVPAAVNARWTRQGLRAVDLFPTILGALGRPIAPGLDGEAVPLARA